VHIRGIRCALGGNGPRPHIANGYSASQIINGRLAMSPARSKKTASPQGVNVVGWLKEFRATAKSTGNDAAIYGSVVFLTFILLCWQPPYVGFTFGGFFIVFWLVMKVLNSRSEERREALALDREREQRNLRLLEVMGQESRQLSFPDKDADQ
jgi:hypothetical protein